MIESFEIILGIIERGLIYALVVMGVHITSRIIKFDDLSVEGSFGLGGAIIAQTIVNGVPLSIGMPLALAAGAAAGLTTGLLHTKLKLNNLISGIVVTTALFSINLKIGGANMTLAQKTTLFSYLPHPLFLLVFIVIGITGIISWFLKTELGYLLYSVGDNEQMLANLGKSIDTYKMLALMLSNTLSALAGALFVQYVGYFSIWANIGVLIIGLAGLILAETISSTFGFALCIGAIAYQAIISTTFELQLDQDWNKLITAVLIVLLIIIKKIMSRN